MRYLVFALALYSALAVTAIAWFIRTERAAEPPTHPAPIQFRKPGRVWT